MCPQGKLSLVPPARKARWRSACRHFITGKGLTLLANLLSKAEQGEPVFHFKIAPDEISRGICSLCNLRESLALLPCQCVPDLWSSPASFRDRGRVPAAGAGGAPQGAALPGARRRMPGAGTSMRFCRKPNSSLGNMQLILNEFPPAHQILQLLVWPIKPRVVSKLTERKRKNMSVQVNYK